MSFDPRNDLLVQLPKDGICAEVGVKQGDFSQRIIDICEPALLFLVDPWQVSDDAKHDGSIYARSVEQQVLDDMYSSVSKRFASRGNVELLRMTSCDAATGLAQSNSDVGGPRSYVEMFDWVYVDGDHLDVYNDLCLWWPLVKPGGVLCGDDYANTNRWWGNAVVDDVNRFASEQNLTVNVVVERQFVLTKPA
jgi:hypothetical protein